MSLRSIVEAGREIPSVGRDFPSEGLGVIHLSHIVKKMGMSPLVYAYPQNPQGPEEIAIPPDRVIYHYVESGIPVLVGIPTKNSGHAVVVIGHTVSRDAWWPHASGRYYAESPTGGPYHCSTAWLQEFLISDDNLGPYLTVSSRFLRERAEEGLLLVVPLPKHVFLKAEDAELYAYKLLQSEKLRQGIERHPKQSSSRFWAEHFWDHVSRNDIVLRTYLSAGSELKARLLSEDTNGEVTELISETPLHDFVWVTEMSTPGLFAQDRQYLGITVLDPTDDPRRNECLFLLQHTPGMLICRNAKSGTTLEYIFDEDHPHPHLVR